MGWGLLEPLDHSHHSDARELNFVARDVIHSEIFSTEGLNCGMAAFLLLS